MSEDSWHECHGYLECPRIEFRLRVHTIWLHFFRVVCLPSPEPEQAIVLPMFVEHGAHVLSVDKKIFKLKSPL